jgi:hypothetical protein
MVLVSLLLLITVVANSVSIGVTTDITTGVGTDGNASISSILGLLKTFWKLLTFQLVGIPVIFNILVFYPITFMVLYMIIDVLKDMISFA